MLNIMTNSNVLVDINERRQKHKFSFGAGLFILLIILLGFVAYPSFLKSQTSMQVAYWTDGLTAQAVGTETWAGSGTQTDAYKLTSAIDLAQLAVNVNAGTTYAGQYFELTNDINLAYKEWTPIGTEAHPFMGEFNGLNKSICYMTITGQYENAGFFGCVENTYLQRITIINAFVDVQAENTGGVVGLAKNTNIFGCANDSKNASKIGLLTNEDLNARNNNVSKLDNWIASAMTRGTIANYSTSERNNATAITNTRNTSTISGSGNAGGIVGKYIVVDKNNTYANSNCCNTASVTTSGSSYAAGGICGWLSANSPGSGNDLHVQVIISSNAGKITGGGWSGGIVGRMCSTCDDDKSATTTIYEVYNLGESGGGTNTGNLVGGTDRDDGTLTGGSPYTRIGQDGKTTTTVSEVIWSNRFFSSAYGSDCGFNGTEYKLQVSHSSSPYTSTAQYQMNGYEYNSSTYDIETTSNVSHVATWSSSNWRQISPTLSGSTYTFIAISPTGASAWSANSYNSTTYTAPTKYTITLNDNSGSGGSGSVTVVSGNYIGSVSVPTRSGYQFDGYYTNKTGGTQYIDEYGDGVRAVSSSLGTLYAHWVGNTYYVRFYSNGGSGSMSNQTMTYGTSSYLDACEFYRSGYTFAGWAKTSSGSVYYDDKEYVGNLTTTYGGYFNLYAVWEEEVYIATLSATSAGNYSSAWGAESYWETGSYKYCTQEISPNETLGTLPSGSQSSTGGVYRKGYTLKGWYTSSSGGSEISSSKTITTDTTFYAQWTANTYTVTLDNQGATMSGSTSATAIYDLSMPSITVPTRTHYTFGGYYTSTGGSGTQYYTSSGASARTWDKTSATTLYAYWQPASITISYNTNGGSAVNSTNVTLNSIFDSFPTTTREGYSFVSWHYDSSLSEASKVTPSTTLVESMLTSTNNTLTLYAKWERLVYNITLQANDATENASSWTDLGDWTASSKTAYKQFTYGDTFTTMPTPIRLGYKFDGWFTSGSGGTKYSEGNTINFGSATTLYAQWTAVNYTLTLNLNGGSLGGASTTINGIIGSVKSITSPTRTGYTFASWTLTSGDGTISGNSFTFKASDATLTATWTANEYKLLFNKNDSSATWENISGFTAEGSNYYLMVTYDKPIGSMPTVKKSGYNFAGWFNASSGGTQYTENTLWTTAGSVTLYAQYTYNSYTLTIDKNNGEGLLSVTKGYGETYTLPSVSKTGYTFSKWEKTSGAGTLSGAIFTMGEGNATITAYWTKNKYTVTYEGNGATGGSTAQSTFEYDTQSTLRPNGFVRTGYQFGGWNTRADGQGTSYTDGHLVLNWTTTNGASFTLYAMWESIRYTVIFDGSGGIIQAIDGFSGVTGKTTSSATYQYNSTFGVLPTVKLKGYTFTGWQNESGDAVSEDDTVTQSTTLYAKFTPNSYTLTLDALNGVMSTVSGWTYGTDNKTATKTIEYGSNFGELPVPTLAGHNFVGWFTTASGGDQYVSSSIYNFENDLKLVPHYTTNNFTILFDANGGQTTINSRVVNYNESIGTLHQATRDGYDFLGWFYINTTTQATTSDKVTTNITLVASWSPKQFTITFDGNTGSLVSGGGFVISNNQTTMSVYYDGEYGTFPTVTQVGANFVGWFDNANGTGKQYISGTTVRITENLTLYAVFSVAEYVIVFNANGGSISYTSKTYQHNDTFGTLPTPTKLGYGFLGWSTSESGTTYVSSSDKVTQSQTLYAQYKANNYKISFNKNRTDAIGTMENLNATYGVSVALTQNGFTSPSAVFVGWSTDASGNGDMFADTQQVSNLTSVDGETITLYAQWEVYVYTLSVVINGGSFGELNGFEKTGYVAKKQYNYNEQIGNLPVVSKTGYNILGFKDSSTQATITSSTVVVANMQIEPIYEQKTITINLKAGEGVFQETSGYTLSTDLKTATTTRLFGETFGTLPTAVREGYEIQGFIINGTSNIINSQAVISSETDITATAEWVENYFTAIFDANGGLIVGDGLNSATYNRTIGYNMPFGELPTAEKTGYTFDGWFTEIVGGTEITTTTTFSYLTNKTFYAHWQASSSTLTINPNGGSYSGSSSNSTLSGNYDETKNLETPTRTGYTFAGFVKTTNGDGTLSGDKTSGYTFTFRLDNETVQAQWTANKVIVNFVYNGATGNNSVSSIEVTYDSTYGSLPTPTLTGQTFGGWFREEAFTNVVVGTDIVKDTQSSITLYAKWSQNEYTLKINANGGEYSGQTTITGGLNQEITLSEPTFVGYTFAEWELQDGFVGSISGNKFTFGAGNGSIIAKWTPIQYSIAFDGGTFDSGSTTQMNNLNYGSSYQLSQNGFVRKGYIFDGWLWNGNTYQDKAMVTNLVATSQTLTFVAQWVVMSSTLTIDPYGGLYQGNQSIYTITENYGKTITLQNATRFGYTFKGYTQPSSGTLGGNKDDGYTFTFGDTNTVITAQWEVKKIIVTFNPNGGQWVNVDNFTLNGGKIEIEVIFGTEYGNMPTEDNISYSGYQFLGWFTNNNEELTSHSLVNYETDIELNAKYNAQPLIVSVNPNAGQFKNTSRITEFSGEVGDKITIEDAVRVGYTFNGWELEGEGTISNGQFTFGSQNALLTAKWIANNYTLKFSANGGTGTMADVPMTYDEPFNLPDNLMSRNGYDFENWNSQADGHGQDYSDKASVINLTTQQGGVVTLYAQWIVQKYVINFDANQGSSSISIMTIDYGKAYGTLPTAVREGYTFLGWFTELENGVRKEATDIVTSAHTLFAHWQAQDYTITFDAQTGSIVAKDGWTGSVGEKTTTKTVTYNGLFGILPEAKHESKTFVGWFTSLQEGTQILDSMVVTYAGNQTLYARYSETIVNVTFDARGGEAEFLQIRLNLGEKYQLPEISRTGYTFNGWFYNGSQITENTTITQPQDHILVAKWTALEFNLIFDYAGGTYVETPNFNGTALVDSASMTITFDMPFGTLPEVKKEGWRFMGWYTSDDTRIYDTMIVSTLSDLDVVAKYETINFDLVINPNGGYYDNSNQTTTITNFYGTEIELLIPTRYGYDFVEWENTTNIGSLSGNLTNGFKFTFGEGNTTIFAKWNPKLVIVKFDAQQGTIDGNNIAISSDKKIGQASYSFGNQFGKMPIGKLDGYRFIGWFTEKTGGLQMTEGKEISNENNFTLYAQYEQNIYHLIINPNGGIYNGTTDTTMYEGAIDETQIVEKPTRVGYNFDQFTFSGSGNIVDNGNDTWTFTYGVGNGTLTARWSALKFVITFDYQGATSGNTTATKEVVFGSQYGTLPTPIKTGYEFKGWFTASSNGDRVDSLQTVNRAENHTLYAQWELQKWTLRVMLTGGSIDGQNVEYVDFEKYYGEQVTFSVPTRYGYDFVEFDKRGNAGSCTISGNQVTFTFGESDVTLVATWQAKTAVVTLDAKEGNINGLNITTINVTFGQVYGALPTPERFGFDFVGWFNSENEQIIASNPVLVEGNHTLTAHYEELASTLTLILDGGTLQTHDGKYQWEKKYGETVSFGIPSKVGFEFVEYVRVGGGSMSVQGTGDDRIFTFTFDSIDAVITAIWRAQTMKVMLDAGNGTIVGVDQQTLEISVEFGGRYDAIYGNLPNAKLYGYSFDGWYTSENELIIGSSTVKIAENHTLTAKYSLLKYILTVDLAGGKIGQDSILKIEQEAGSKYIFATLPELTGHNFVNFVKLSGKGTIDQSGANGEWVFTFDDADATISAVFEAKTFVLTLNANGADSIESATNGEWTISQDGSYATKTVTYGQKYGKLPKAMKSGSNFIGWFTQTEDGVQITEITNVEILDDLQLYANWLQDKYLLTVELNGGTYNGNTQNLLVQGVAGEIFTLQHIPTKIGHTFNGFILADGSFGTLTENTSNQMQFTFGAGNAVIQCQFVANPITVTLNVGSGNFVDLENWEVEQESGNKAFNGWIFDGNKKVSKTFVYGDKLGQMPIASMKGNKFSGWFVESVQFVDNSVIEWTTATQELTANYSLTQFTLVINPNGGIYNNSSSVQNIARDYQSNYDVLTPTREGYKFMGWTPIPETDGEGELNNNVFTFGADNFTIIANWEAITYFVDFNANGGQGRMEKQTFTYDIANLLNENIFTRNGYVFTGWLDEFGNSHNNKELIRNLTSIQDDVITMNAIWETAVFNVYYDSNNGTVRPIATKVKYLDQFGEMPTASRTGYTFAGWYVAIENGQPVGNQILPTTINDFIGDRTLIAHWTINTYTITLPDIDEDSATLNIADGYTTQVLYNEDFAFTITLKEAYNKSRIRVFANNDEILTIDGVYFISRVAEDITITVRDLNINTYVVTFNSLGGSQVAPYSSVPYGTTITPPTAPTMLHYVFVKWYVDADLTEEFDFSTRIYEDITLYASYEKATYAVTFYLSEENPTQYGQVQNVVYLEKATRPDNPYVDGYDFIGWYEIGATTPFDFRSQITGNVNLYGRYSANTFTVTFYNGDKILGQRRVEYGNFVLPYEYTELTGYNFIGWFVEKECLTPYDFNNMPILKDTNIYAKYEVIKFEVKFYIDNDCQATKIVDYNTRVTGPTNLVLPIGMHFVAWYLDPQFTLMFDFNETITEDITLYGKYEQDEIALTFIILDQVELRYIKHGFNLSQINIPSLPTKAGYTQVAPYFTWTDANSVVWTLVFDANGDYFENANGDIILLNEFVVEKSYQFVAVYTVNIYTITLIMPDGSKEIRYVEHGGALKDLPEYKLTFGDKLVFDQDLSYILGDMTVNVKVKNYIKIPLIIVVILVAIGIITTVIIFVVKAVKKRDHRGKLKELIDKKW